MSLEDFVTTFGYPALFAGTFLEGETFLLLAGFMAHRGYLDLSLVMLTGFLAALISDELFFFIGKTKGMRLAETKPQWQARIVKVRRLLDLYSTRMVLSFRFLYGLRTVSPFVIGMSNFSTRLFVCLDTLGAALWVVMIASAGYFFGHALETVIDDVKRYELGIAVAFTVIGVSLWLVRGRLLLRRSRHPKSE